MADLEGQVSATSTTCRKDSAAGMLIYAMVQELATFVHYRNLRRKVDEEGDPALSQLLGLIAVDERAHHAFYRTRRAAVPRAGPPGDAGAAAPGCC